MGDVIGYKGTVAQRRLSWKTMLSLRACMKDSREKSKGQSWEAEERWYKEEFTNYIAA